MFETIIELFVFAFWTVAIILFLGGIIICISNLISGSGWEKTMAVIAFVLGIVTFFYMYDWSESIAWCLMATGLVLCFVGQFGSNEVQQAPPKEPGLIETFAEGYLDAYAKKKLMEEAFTDALRKSKE